MKKKIALTLSAIMLLSPLSVFAVSKNELSTQPTSLVKKSLFMEERTTENQNYNLKVNDEHVADVEYLADGPYLVVNINERVDPKTTFKINLENAEFAFRAYVSSNQVIGRDQTVAMFRFMIERFVSNSTDPISPINGYTFSGIESSAALSQTLYSEVIGLFAGNANKMLTTYNYYDGLAKSDSFVRGMGLALEAIRKSVVVAAPAPAPSQAYSWETPTAALNVEDAARKMKSNVGNYIDNIYSYVATGNATYTVPTDVNERAGFDYIMNELKDNFDLIYKDMANNKNTYNDEFIRVSTDQAATSVDWLAAFKNKFSTINVSDPNQINYGQYYAYARGFNNPLYNVHQYFRPGYVGRNSIAFAEMMFITNSYFDASNQFEPSKVLDLQAFVRVVDWYYPDVTGLPKFPQNVAAMDGTVDFSPKSDQYKVFLAAVKKNILYPNFNFPTEVTVPGWDKNAPNYDAATYHGDRGLYFPLSNVYLPTFMTNRVSSNKTLLVNDYSVPYSMTVSSTGGKGDAWGTVRIYDDFSGLSSPTNQSMPVGFETKMFANSQIGGNYAIPMVVRSNEIGDLRVSITESNHGPIATGNLQIGTTASANTKTVIPELTTSKYNFKIPRIEIKEQVANSIKNNKTSYVVLEAPYGYYWADPTKPTVNANGDDEYSFFETSGTLFMNPIGGDYSGVTGTGAIIGTNKSEQSNRLAASSFAMKYGYWNSDEGLKLGSKDSVVINIGNGGLVTDTEKTTATFGSLNITPTTSTNGVLTVRNLVLVAQDYAPMNEDINIKVYSSDNTGVTEETVKVGTRSDYLLKLERKEEIPTLVSGRYVDIKSTDEFKRSHKGAKVKVSESVVASWWSLRESDFVLTEGVKFRQVKISEEENFNHTNRSFTLNNTYQPKTEKINYIDLKTNRLRFADLSIKVDKTVTFEMDVWMSIQPGFEGDIYLGLSGDSIVDKQVESVVIAKAVNPITVKTEVRDIRIGYQWQQAADFTITETAAGRLMKDTEVIILIDDDISEDEIFIAPDFLTEINSDSTIGITKPTVNKGKISFSIEKPSYKTAATIKFSSVYLKVNRNVPESNRRAYKVVVGGTAIAGNYYLNATAEMNNANKAITTSTALTKITSIDPVFNIKGIGADYFYIVTSANDKDSILSNIVRIQDGSNILRIGRDDGDEQVEMDTESFIDADTNSMMVPVRWVARALGIPNDQVQWDEENRKVTIYNGARVVQFAIGVPEITVNGVTTIIYSADDIPFKVSPMIKDMRSFLPYRAIGNALGVEVGYLPETRTAVFNYTLYQESLKENK